MSLLLRTPPLDDGRTPPSLTGFSHRDDRWQLETAYYRTFIRDVTGIDLDGEPTIQEIKTVQSRLEGCLEASERDGTCVCRPFDRYDHVDTEAIYGLARFFRVFVAVRIEGAELRH